MVAAWVAAYRERFPEMRVDYVPSDHKVDLIAERIDLALRVGPMADSTLRGVLLEELEVWTLASPAYVQRRGAPRNPKELAAHERVALSLLPTPWTLDFVPASGRRRRVRLHGAVSAASNAAVRGLVLAGAGISAFPSTASTRDDVEAGRLVRLLPGWRLKRVFLYAVYPGGVAPPAKTRALIDLVKEKLKVRRSAGPARFEPSAGPRATAGPAAGAVRG